MTEYKPSDAEIDAGAAKLHEQVEVHRSVNIDYEPESWVMLDKASRQILIDYTRCVLVAAHKARENQG